MFGSTILETAIGLIFVYLLFSLICSGIREWISALMKVRAKTLKKGIEGFLEDEELVKRIYNHPLVRGQESGETKTGLPKSLSGSVFAETFLDCIMKAESSAEAGGETGDAAPDKDVTEPNLAEKMKQSVDKIDNFLVRKALQDQLDRLGLPFGWMAASDNYSDPPRGSGRCIGLDLQDNRYFDIHHGGIDERAVLVRYTQKTGRSPRWC
ncbi:MAG: hypothetical protein GY950_34520 [bacterium]|nr:hypothetical protein [bacterium]